jgi:riboflavin biosynthesis pyrimidine reductase
VRRLFPDPVDDPDLAAAYAVPDGRHVRVNFVSSLDGAATLDGRSGGLSGPGDRTVFHLLRTLADVVLVGAGTVRAEGYGPARDDGERAPAIAVVSRSLALDPGARLFTESAVRPIVLTSAGSPEPMRRALHEVADVIVAGDADVEPAAALDALADRGLAHVICEGGPHLFGQLLAAGVVDELCLTLSPTLAGGSAGRIVDGVRDQTTVPMRLQHVLEDGGHLFLRYARR